jgi:NAD+ synthase
MDIASRLHIDTDLVHDVLVRFIREEVGKFGIQRAVIGLSGGIDSAVSCVLAAEALGAANVLAVCMPYRSSSPASLADAQELIAQVGVPSEVVPITEMVEPLFARFPDISDRRKGNVMARARMVVLYDRSAAWGGLVVGTSNKTEILLGYGTLFGDMASAANPLGDLYKTQVRELAAAIGVPASIRNKAPSADLWSGQTDEGELGITYAEVDCLLYLLVDQRYRPRDAVAAGFAPALVERVTRLVRDNHFKRLPPIIAKLSSRTIGHDFRYLRDWGH